MTALPLQFGLLLAAVLFLIGLGGLLFRRNLVFTLLSLEIMLNAAALAFIVAASRWQQADGQVVFLLILAIAGVETAVGLAIILGIHRVNKTLDPDEIGSMRG